MLASSGTFTSSGLAGLLNPLRDAKVVFLPLPHKDRVSPLPQKASDILDSK